MKWKDSGESVEKEDKTSVTQFDEEQYSPWADRKDAKTSFKLSKFQVVFILLILAVVALAVELLMLLSNGNNGTGTIGKIEALESRVRQLEERLDKYDSIDEKVTRIWEQAKAFEKFKDRFDRSEASTSLRMDHLTMSLESLQKQVNEAHTAKKPAVPDKASPPEVAPKPAAKIQYHEVTAGETLYSISKLYDLSVEALLKLNRMKPGTVIVPGQKIIVRGGGTN